MQQVLIFCFCLQPSTWVNREHFELIDLVVSVPDSVNYFQQVNVIIFKNDLWKVL